MICPNCKKQIPDGSACCGYCGREIPKVPLCTHCGAELRPNDRFCGVCGAPVEVKKMARDEEGFDAYVDEVQQKVADEVQRV